MKTRNFLCCFALFFAPVMHAQTTAFTYQGKLSVNGSPASGNYDLQFILFNVNQFGFPAAPILTNGNVGVSGGLFTTTLDFGGNIFTGTNYWLEIGVRTNGSTGAFTTLAPRQPITPTPYAINAASATAATTAANVTGAISDAQLSGNVAKLNGLQNFSGAVTFNNASGTFFGNGAGVTNVNAATLNGLASANFWKTGGNSGTTPGTDFIGTSDNQPLELKVNGVRILRLEPNSTNTPNLTVGFSDNKIDATVVGSVIAGGGFLNNSNRVTGSYSAIGGGYNNYVTGGSSTIAGGDNNTVGSDRATVGGGYNNRAFGQLSTVAGGDANRAGGVSASVAGGSRNTGDGDNSFIGGGYFNTIQPNASFSSIGGGYQNTIQPNASYSTIGGGAANTVQPNAFYSAIGGGYGNTIQTNADHSTIGGGYQNTIQINASRSVIGGGSNNTVLAHSSAIAGGIFNTNTGPYAAIPGGDKNVAGTNSLAAGHRAKAIHTGSFVWADSFNADFATTATNQFLIRASGGVGIGTISPSGGLHVSSSGADAFPQAWINQANSADYARLRFTITNDYNSRWDMAVVTNAFVIYSGTFSAEMLKLDSVGLTVRGTFVSSSDRNVKENFAGINNREVLEKVSRLPITSWNYKEDKSSQHIGPMAQDFHAAFGVGPDDKHITTIDESGVALAAIQGLNELVKEKDAKISSLEKRLSDLEQLVQSIAESK